ncbi:MAG: hypothetical protein R3Y46_02285 [Opitutales bacterium]
MNCRIFTLLISILFLNTISFAQSSAVQDDPVKIDGVKFSYISPAKSKKKWAKAEMKIVSKGDLAAKAAGEKNDTWLKDVEIGMTCAYDNADKQMVWFSSSVEFIALEKGEAYSVIFYVPAEVLEMNRVNKYAPEGYVISLKANGVEYPMTADNWKSRTNASTATKAKTLFDAAEDNRSAGMMIYYEDAPFGVKLNDGGREMLPTPVYQR